MFKESVKPSNYPSLCRPLLLMPSVFTSSRAFSNGLVLRIRWPKSWSFSFSINSPNDLLDWFTLGLTCLISFQFKGLKSLLRHYSSKASILRCSAFFTVQLSHPYMTIGKTIALTRWTPVSKVMSLLSNMLSRLVMYGCESWTVKKAEHRRIDAFEL